MQPRFLYSLRTVIALVSSLVATATIIPTRCVAQNTPTIHSISGWQDVVRVQDQDIYSIKDGRWMGQPAAVLLTPGASNRYNGYLAVETHLRNTDLYFWEIIGTGFGTQPGTVTVRRQSGGSAPITCRVVTGGWSNTKIKCVPEANYVFGAEGSAQIIVTTSNQMTASRNDAVTSVLNTRGFGQCTWFAAKRRLDSGLSIPASAYPALGAVGVTAIPSVGQPVGEYQPNYLDYLIFQSGGDRHVAVITSRPRETIQRNGAATYSFQVGEMNVGGSETISYSNKTFSVGAGSVRSSRIVLSGILSGAASRPASRYFRQDN